MEMNGQVIGGSEASTEQLQNALRDLQQEKQARRLHERKSLDWLLELQQKFRTSRQRVLALFAKRREQKINLRAQLAEARSKNEELNHQLEILTGDLQAANTKIKELEEASGQGGAAQSSLAEVVELQSAVQIANSGEEVVAIEPDEQEGCDSQGACIVPSTSSNANQNQDANYSEVSSTRNQISSVQPHKKGYKNYSCPTRFKKVKYPTDLTRPHMIHTGEKPYKCATSYKSFTAGQGAAEGGGLAEAIQQQGQPPYVEIANSDEEVGSIDSNHDEEDDGCDLVEKRVISSGSANKNQDSDPLEVSSTSKQNLGPHQSQGQEYQELHIIYCCHFCFKKFNLPVYLTRHLRTHTGEKPNQSKMCGTPFTQKSGLDNNAHSSTGKKQFQCNWCAKFFEKNSKFTEHVRTHTGEKPYQCKLCTRSFAQKSTLTIHVRSHTGEKPYQCRRCQIQFTSSSSLTKHKKAQLHLKLAGRKSQSQH